MDSIYEKMKMDILTKEYYLKHGDIVSARISFKTSEYTILDERHLPYFVRSSPDTDFIGNVESWLRNRVFDAGRKDSANIKKSANLPLSMNTADKLTLALRCYGVSMKDTYWICPVDSDQTFENISFKPEECSKNVLRVGLNKATVNAGVQSLRLVLTASGNVPKCWYFDGEYPTLYKGESSMGMVYNEIFSYEVLEHLGVDCVPYLPIEVNGSKYSTTYQFPEISVIEWWELKNKLLNEGVDIYKFLMKNWTEKVADMVIADYIVANGNRSSSDFGFIIDEDTCEIKAFAPLWDFNECLYDDKYNSDINYRIYEPLNMKYIDAVNWALTCTTIDIIGISEKFTDGVNGRIKFLKSILAKNGGEDENVAGESIQVD